MMSAPAFGLIDRLIDQRGDRIVIDDIARFINQPVLPVRGIGVERDVGQHADAVAAGGFDRADRLAHQVVGIMRLAPIIAAQFARGVGEQRDHRDAERDRFLRARHDPVDRPARYAGQTGDRFLHPRSRT